ncbi:MAG TPA: hypothetical protein PLT32_01890 [bacterium]|nr:hypothetical protein [bacterium]
MFNKQGWPTWARLLVVVATLAIIVATWWLIIGRQPKNMDQLGFDNLYHYRNEDLKFNLDLPEQFIYYQTERTNSADYREIKFYVPTSDPEYTNATPPSYARPIVVRVFDEEAWKKLSDEDESKKDFTQAASRDSKVYLISFWDKQPADWQGKWSEAMKESITKSLQ